MPVQVVPVVVRRDQHLAYQRRQLLTRAVAVAVQEQHLETVALAAPVS